MRKYLSDLVFTALLAITSHAASAQDTGKQDYDCVYLTRQQAHEFFTVDFEQRTINGQPAMIGPDAMHWKVYEQGYKLDRLTGILTLLNARHNVSFKLRCTIVTEH